MLATFRATLSGLGFNLVKTPRGYAVIDRRPELDDLSR
jgi:hypothetical protein